MAIGVTARACPPAKVRIANVAIDQPSLVFMVQLSQALCPQRRAAPRKEDGVSRFVGHQSSVIPPEDRVVGRARNDDVSVQIVKN